MLTDIDFFNRTKGYTLIDTQHNVMTIADTQHTIILNKFEDAAAAFVVTCEPIYIFTITCDNSTSYISYEAYVILKDLLMKQKKKRKRVHKNNTPNKKIKLD